MVGVDGSDGRRPAGPVVLFGMLDTDGGVGVGFRQFLGEKAGGRIENTRHVKPDTQLLAQAGPVAGG